MNNKHFQHLNTSLENAKSYALFKAIQGDHAFV